MSLEVKKTKIKELLNRKIITQLEHDRIIEVLLELADEREIISIYKEVYNICIRNTSKQLIEPKSAVYPPFSEDMIEELGVDSYLISLYVDSANKKGEMLRTNIKCKVENDQYVGTSFQIKKARPRIGGAKITEEWTKFTRPK